MATGNPRIAPTAHYTAQAWVREGFPHAERFDTPTGRRLFGALHLLTRLAGPLAPPMIRHHEEYLFLRHHAYEARLKELAPSFVLEIGAGLSPRGIALTEADPKLTYVEADLPHMVAAKRRRLRGYRAAPGYHLDEIDLLGPGFDGRLPARPSPGEGAVVITEGVSDYLDRAEKQIAWSNIASFLKSAGGGRYLFEIHPMERFRGTRAGPRFYLALLGLLVGRSFEGRVFEEPAEAAELICRCGFESARVLDAAALNAPRPQPPAEHCPWVLMEARLG